MNKKYKKNIQLINFMKYFNNYYKILKIYNNI